MEINERKTDMRKTFFVVMLSLLSVGMMAQAHGPRGGYESERAPHSVRNHGGRHQIECATHDQMALVLKTLDNQSFDDKKLEVGKLCVVLGHFCTDDLARMAKKFSFDDSRKQFLVFAYEYCEDPQNYYDLQDVFSFRSQFDEMMREVRPNKRRR